MRMRLIFGNIAASCLVFRRVEQTREGRGNEEEGRGNEEKERDEDTGERRMKRRDRCVYRD